MNETTPDQSTPPRPTTAYAALPAPIAAEMAGWSAERLREECARYIHAFSELVPKAQQHAMLMRWVGLLVTHYGRPLLDAAGKVAQAAVTLSPKDVAALPEVYTLNEIKAEDGSPRIVMAQPGTEKALVTV